jgi:hypothetical protein
MNAAELPTLNWCEQWVAKLADTPSIAIGLISGHREPNDPRSVHRIARRMSEALTAHPGRLSMLVCQLDIHTGGGMLSKKCSETLVEPEITKSPLGNWHQVQVAMRIGASAPEPLQRLPRWLAKWKHRHSLILVDLGPIHLVPSRMLGRLCDANYLMLGPNWCASSQWLLQYVDYHEYCGSHILGTVVTTIAA